MKEKVTLPGIYTKDVWIRGGSVPEHEKFIGLPRISWSQIESFNSKSGFNTGLLGEYEYILNYFTKAKFFEYGWGSFGSETEAYITLRNLPLSTIEAMDQKTQKEFNDSLINFTAKEKETLDKIEPLGVFQDEICYYVKELDIIVLGYIDDRSFPDENGNVEMLRDYKTKSESSKKDLHDAKKFQIELYVLGLMQRGLTVKNAEYCIIERFGGKECMFGGGRQSLSVGERIWYEPYTWDQARLDTTHLMVIDTALKISKLYSTYLKFFK